MSKKADRQFERMLKDMQRKFYTTEELQDLYNEDVMHYLDEMLPPNPGRVLPKYEYYKAIYKELAFNILPSIERCESDEFARADVLDQIEYGLQTNTGIYNSVEDLLVYSYIENPQSMREVQDEFKSFIQKALEAKSSKSLIEHELDRFGADYIEDANVIIRYY